MQQLFRRPAALSLLTRALIVFICSSAQTTSASTWSNASGGSWQTPGNWTGGVPTSSDAANFSLAKSYTVTLASGAAAGSVNLSAGTVNFNFGSAALDVSSTLTIGSSATLTLSSGSINANSAIATGTFSMVGGQLNTRALDFSAATGFNFSGGTIGVTGGEWRPKLRTTTVNVSPALMSFNAAELSGSGATPTVRLQGASFSMATNSSDALLIGHSGGNGQLIANNTTGKTYYFYVGVGRDATGAVAGTGTVLYTSGTLNSTVYVGAYGGRGYVDLSNTRGVGLEVGFGSTQVGTSYIGGEGTVVVRDGTQLSSSYLDIGYGGGKGWCDLVGPTSKITLVNAAYIGSVPDNQNKPNFVAEGTLNISNGAQLETTSGHGSSPIHIGYLGGKGTVTVDGANSLLTTPDFLLVGAAGYSNNGNTVYSEGTLRLSNGAKASASDVTVGSATNGLIDIGSATLTTNWFTLGAGQYGATHFANGIVNIHDGGWLSSAVDASVGSQKGFGTVMLSGANSTWSNAFLYIGNDSTGQADRNGFGTVSIDNHAQMTNGILRVFAGGRLLLSNGATLQTATPNLSGNPTNFIWTGGTLKIMNGTPTTDGLLTVPNTGTLSGTGNILRSVLVNAGGTLAPGAGVGTISTGALTLSPDSTYFIEVDINANAADKTRVTGTVGLASSELNFNLLTGAPPLAAPRTYVIIDNDLSDAVVGAFDGLAEDITYHRDGVEFSVNYHGGDGNDVAITFTEVPEPQMSLAVVALAALLLRRLPRRTTA
jgi:T5SS/PEP-CTERM-associated repeat protein